MNQIKKFMSSTKELQVQKKSSKNPINKGFLEPFECRRQHSLSYYIGVYEVCVANL